jgi:hypothetical protein
MDWGYFFLAFFVFSTLWIIAQRIAQRHQRAFRGFILLFAIFWASWRFERFPWEMIWAFVAALFISSLFWLLIGRYNPVGNADDENIKVYGLDD